MHKTRCRLILSFFGYYFHFTYGFRSYDIKRTQNFLITFISLTSWSLYIRITKRHIAFQKLLLIIFCFYNFAIQLQNSQNRVNRLPITQIQEPSKPSSTQTEMPIPTIFCKKNNYSLNRGEASVRITCFIDILNWYSSNIPCNIR